MRRRVARVVTGALALVSGTVRTACDNPGEH